MIGCASCGHYVVTGRLLALPHQKEARATASRSVLLGMLERGGQVRATGVESRKKATLQADVHAHVEAGSALYSDELLSYEGLAGRYAHQVVDHAVEYVRDVVHTNGMENFWALLKRGIARTYVPVEPFHLFRYLDVQSFRFNTRKDEQGDFGRFRLAASQVVGKRLTYDERSGKTHDTSAH